MAKEIPKHMNRKFFLVLVTLLTLTFAQFAPTTISLGQANAKTQQFNVEAKGAEEAAVLQTALARVYPTLAPDQKAIIDKGLVFAVSYWEPITSRFSGYGPEDDPAYRYPDKTLYPGGTIKVNITLKSIERESLSQRVSDPRVRVVLQEIFRMLVVHEVEHVHQYMTKPVLALGKPEECPGGVCDPARLEDTRLKTGYEFDALGRDFEVRSRVPREDVQYTMKYFDEHPELLTGRLQQTLKKDLVDFDTEHAITEWRRTLYSAEYRLPSLTKECVEHGGTLSEESTAEARKFLDFNSKENNLLVQAYSHLAPVFETLNKCVGK